MTLPWETDLPDTPTPEARAEFKRGELQRAAELMSDLANDEPLTGEIVDEPTGLVNYEPPAAPAHHVVTGMAALARMPDDEYERAIETIQKGIERVKDFQQRAMTAGEDYGKVRGIDRPFLHLPGAEKLCLLYGLAARQEADRLIGRRAVVKSGAFETEDGEWLSPPLAYHVRTYIHLGNFDGPIIAMGYGEASSWEEKYRYRWAKPKCPECGREGLIRGKPDGKLKGKWWCPGRENGCNRTYEPNDPRIENVGKVENTDPHSLAETLLQMAAKRSFVAGTRRATGTSGLFTQDEDSPSVQDQADKAPPEGGDDSDVVPKLVTGVEVEAGAKTTTASRVQINEIVTLSQEKDLGPVGISSLLGRLFNLEVAEDKRSVSAAVKKLTGDQAGKLIHAIRTGEVPEEEATPGFPPQQSDEM